ncbi:MAG: hypothetical protein Q7T10_03080 [Rhodoferax sp.]|uniref:hypothetical protein n=1 Tax=Rhodoferax sp. TaxID=50421 RepID=UPI0027231D4B|nr:hypothetical protein [Rhodoferax sp.]MDO8447771.1 hypothetical protein [Rhodoferax sp.]
MGAGKSTASRAFGERITAAGLQVATYTEAADPHPVRASDDLADFFQPWLEVEPSVLACRVRAKWARYVDRRLNDRVFTVMDGQLFHGDQTHLFMMEMRATDLRAHVAELMGVLDPLGPVVIYFRHTDVRRAIHAVFEARGGKWESYQLDWKLRSPYAKHRKLEGLLGLTTMYEEYRGLTDSLFASLNCRKLTIEADAGDWHGYYTKITQLLEEANVRV